MRCPACGTQLQHKTVIGVELDQCAACSGFWFDDGEMSQLVPQLAQVANVPDLDARIIHEKPTPGHINPQRRCPRCTTVMANYNYCYDSNILLDRCPDCRGVWLDGGELALVAQYVKGNPRLDRLALSMAGRVSARASQKDAVDRLPTGIGLGLMNPGLGSIAMLLALVVDAVRRWNED